MTAVALYMLLDTLLRLALFGLGFVTVIVTISSALRTFVVPRTDNVFLTRVVFISVRRLFNRYLDWRKIDSYEGRDGVLAYYAPLSLLLLPVVWLVYITLGYMLMYWAIGISSWEEAFTISGSSLLTLGTTPFINIWVTVLQFSEATLGLGMVALLLAYLPTMYSNFSRREAKVAMLAVRAGSPPSAVEMIARAYRIGGFEKFNESWEDWEIWFTELEESHTSLAPLIFFRSPQPENSWITSAGTIMDAASLLLSTVDMQADPSAQLCIRAGYIALRRIADFFFFQYDSDPIFPEQPISITRSEFDEAYDQLASWGIPLKSDRERCWLDYAGWRVNYDQVLLFLANITQAPYAPWSSDRGSPFGTAEYQAVLAKRGG